MLISFFLTDEYSETGQRVYRREKQRRDVYVLEHVNQPAIPPIGSRVAFMKGDGSGAVYFRVNMLIYSPSLEVNALSLARGADSLVIFVMLDITKVSEKDLSQIIDAPNAYTPSRWRMIPADSRYRDAR